MKRRKKLLFDGELLTLSGLPATSAALEAMVCFSSSDFTGPFKVTWPFTVMILTLWA
jgi:hypothetical protein